MIPELANPDTRTLPHPTGRRRRPVVATVLLMLASALACAPPLIEPARAAEAVKKAQSHGALAWDRANHRYGYAVSRPTARAAATEALRQCGDGGCEVVLAFKSSCGALVRRGERIFTASGATRAEAEAKALRRCESAPGAACEPVVWGCNR